MLQIVIYKKINFWEEYTPLLCTIIYIKKFVVCGEIYTAGKIFYTAAGSNGIYKFHIWCLIQS